MKELLIKYRMILMLILLVPVSIFMESPYQGNYYGEPPILFYLLITLVILLIYLIPKTKLNFTEKFIYSTIISCFVLVISGIIIEKILSIIYGYDAYYGELKSPELLDNILFLFFAIFSGIGILNILFYFKESYNK
tara:strand:- start:5890 stop:6297 length:408 start_codon:yes stop_codon:yes gene_type:complete